MLRSASGRSAPDRQSRSCRRPATALRLFAYAAPITLLRWPARATRVSSPQSAASPTVTPVPSAATPRGHRQDPEQFRESQSGATNPTSSSGPSSSAAGRPLSDRALSRPRSLAALSSRAPTPGATLSAVPIPLPIRNSAQRPCRRQRTGSRPTSQRRTARTDTPACRSPRNAGFPCALTGSHPRTPTPAQPASADCSALPPTRRRPAQSVE